MSGDHNMNQRPKALELADALDAIHYHNADSLLSINVIKQAGSELSRLHEENEALRADSEMLRKIAFLLKGQNRFSGGYDSMVAQALERIDADEALLRQALEALERGESALRFAAIAAIKEHLK